jgi:hypothetical protein
MAGAIKVHGVTNAVERVKGIVLSAATISKISNLKIMGSHLSAFLQPLA